MRTYDLIVIGSGGASIVADAAIAAGKKVAIIEKTKFGGTCATRGCIPTKVMVTAANAIREIEDYQHIGIKTAPASIDWSLMSKRVWEVINRHKGTQKYYEDAPNTDAFWGTASFVDNHTINMIPNDGSESIHMTAPTIIIGVGGHSKVAPTPGLEEAGYLTSENLFGQDYPDKPYKSLIVIGGGPIGTEFAHVFSAAGTEVTLVQRNVRLLPKEDEAVSQASYDNMKDHMNIFLNTVIESVQVEKGEKVVTVRNRDTNQVTQLRAQEILIATGIQPAIEELGLEHTDIDQLPGGWIKTNEFLETSVDGIYALGDVNGGAQFRHKANYEADIIAHNLYRAHSIDDMRWARYDVTPAVTYTYPEVGHVGLTEKEAQEQGYKVKTGINHYSTMAKGFAMGLIPGETNDGFVKIVVDADTNTILGMHVIGPQASILFQPFVNLMNAGPTRIIPIHEEIASERAKKARAKGIIRPMDPHSVITVGETMTPHPSLSEVIMWTQYYLEKRW